MNFLKQNEFSFNFGRINQYIVLAVVFFISLIVGITGSTDVYDKFSKLPDDRNELTSIKHMEAFIESGSNLIVRVQLDAITQLTVANLYNNINAHVEFENISLIIHAQNAVSNPPSSNFFDFTYKLPVFGRNVSLQLFLVDTPISKAWFFDVIKDEKDNDFQSTTTFDQSVYNNICINNGKLQTFFKGKPSYNIKNLKMPIIQDYSDFKSVKNNNVFYTEKSILIYNNDEQIYQNPFSKTMNILHAVHLADDSKVFVYNLEKEEIFQKTFNIENISPKSIYCFSSLQILNPYNEPDSTQSIKSEILTQLKKRDSSSKYTYETKPMISYFMRENSSIDDQSDVFQALCPDCEINTISTSNKSFGLSDLYNVANSKIVIGFHSDLLVSAISLYNTNNDCLIIDLLPAKLKQCGDWIKNMKGIAKTIVYDITNEKSMYYSICCNNNYDDCMTEKCTSLLDGIFHLDTTQIKKAINLSNDECPSNLIAVNGNDVRCLNSRSF